MRDVAPVAGAYVHAAVATTLHSILMNVYIIFLSLDHQNTPPEGCFVICVTLKQVTQVTFHTVLRDIILTRVTLHDTLIECLLLLPVPVVLFPSVLWFPYLRDHCPKECSASVTS